MLKLRLHIVPAYALVALVFALLANSCFTGVEGTKAITQKDVNKAKKQKRAKYGRGNLALYTVDVDTFPQWETGKRFYVANGNVSHLFAAPVPPTSIARQLLTYQGYLIEKSLDGKDDVTLRFSDSNGIVYSLPTGKTMGEITENSTPYTVPFLIDLDEIMQLKSMLTGMKLWVRTSSWYNEWGEMIRGRKFVSVTIEDVVPGNDVFPYMVRFTDGDKTAFLYMSSPLSPVTNRSLADLFSVKNIHDQYPQISDENWAHIINEEVAVDMTKEEAKLALGQPKNIDSRATMSGLMESWTYENGMYLIFEDGLLRRFRR